MLIFYERTAKFKKNIAHTFIHCVPVDISKLEDVKLKLENIILMNKLDFYKLRFDDDIFNFVKTTDFHFMLEFCKETNNWQKYLYLMTDDEKAKNLPLDFGRQVICEAL